MHCPRLNGIMRAGDLELTRKKRREEQEEGSQRMAGLGGSSSWRRRARERRRNVLAGSIFAQIRDGKILSGARVGSRAGGRDPGLWSSGGGS